jgi:hypothetical protein
MMLIKDGHQIFLLRWVNALRPYYGGMWLQRWRWGMSEGCGKNGVFFILPEGEI